MRTMNVVIRVGVACAVAMALTIGAAAGQSAPVPRVTFAGGIDVLPGAAYVFRGITQESSPELTLWPAVDLGVTLASSDRATLRANIGTWNSLHTGSSGLDGRYAAGYESDVYGTLSAAVAGNMTVGATYTAYTSPNGLFNTVKEFSVKAARADRVSPYALVAFELAGGAAADGGQPGTYFEVGIGPMFPLVGNTTLTVPVKLGLSLADYYQHPVTGVDHRFGYVDAGLLVTKAFASHWNVHAGVNVLGLGQTTRQFNGGDNRKVTGLLGIGWSY